MPLLIFALNLITISRVLVLAAAGPGRQVGGSRALSGGRSAGSDGGSSGGRQHRLLHVPSQVLVRLKQAPVEVESSGDAGVAAAVAIATALPGVRLRRILGHSQLRPAAAAGRSLGDGEGTAGAQEATATATDAATGTVLLLDIVDGSCVQTVLKQLRQHPTVDIAEANSYVHLGPILRHGAGASSSSVGASSSSSASSTSSFVRAAMQQAGARRWLGDNAAGPAGPAGLPNDTFYQGRHTLWHLNQIQAPVAWRTTTGLRSVGVCVIDSGAQTDHEDLAANIVQAWNRGCLTCTGGKRNAHDTGELPPEGTPEYSDVTDLDGHGTHCAGIIGAVGDNGVGVCGVNWQVGLHICRVTSGPRLAIYRSSILDCLAMCQQAGVRVVSASVGMDEYSELEKAAIRKLGQAGVLFVAAAGNAGADMDALPIPQRHYPACHNDLDNLVSVAASRADDNLTSDSNYGRTTVHLAAPGLILSTVPNATTRYEVNAGTSMACPLVAGAAALLFSALPSATPQAVREALLSSVDLVPALSSKLVTGGRLNVAQALAQLLNATAPLPRLSYSEEMVVEVGWSYAFSDFQSRVEVADQFGDSWRLCRDSCSNQSWCFYFSHKNTSTAEGQEVGGRCITADASSLRRASPRWGYTAGHRRVVVPEPGDQLPPSSAALLIRRQVNWATLGVICAASTCVVAGAAWLLGFGFGSRSGLSPSSNAQQSGASRSGRAGSQLGVGGAASSLTSLDLMPLTSLQAASTSGMLAGGANVTADVVDDAAGSRQAPA